MTCGKKHCKCGCKRKRRAGLYRVKPRTRSRCPCRKKY